MGSSKNKKISSVVPSCEGANTLLPPMLKTTDFDYHLPKDLIATHPPKERSQSRLMVIDRRTETINHARFADFPGLLEPGDLCVMNDTQVVAARFYANDGRKEILRLDFHDDLRWRCLVRPGKKMRIGDTIALGSSTGTVEEIFKNGDRLVAFDQAVDIEAYGKLALPHYMERESETIDRTRYQTVYAREAGAIAAPTAGLHFTDAILAEIPHVFLTLHVGVGTFQPVREELVENHRMHAESFAISQDTIDAIENANRTVAIGTTVMRVLEHVACAGKMKSGSGETSIFIYPPYTFKAVDRLLTNFHLPQSTLLMLISAFAGTELIREAYRQAVAERYRFFSYGDAMFIR